MPSLFCQVIFLWSCQSSYSSVILSCQSGPSNLQATAHTMSIHICLMCNFNLHQKHLQLLITKWPSQTKNHKQRKWKRTPFQNKYPTERLARTMLFSTIILIQLMPTNSLSVVNSNHSKVDIRRPDQLKR